MLNLKESNCALMDMNQLPINDTKAMNQVGNTKLSCIIFFLLTSGTDQESCSYFILYICH